MKCIVCGEELGDIEICPVCGTKQVKKVKAVATKKENKVEVPKIDEGSFVFDKNINGVMIVYFYYNNMVYFGTGFLLNKEGFVLTNTHVVSKPDGSIASDVYVNFCNQTIEADVISTGFNNAKETGVDLAILKLKTVPIDAKCVEFADSKDVKNGETVYIIGNSHGEGLCITRGIVSDKHHDLREGNNRVYTSYIMTDCAINGGNSGGPMFNKEGESIGVVVSSYEKAKGMNFTIPSSDAMTYLNSQNIKFYKK